MVAGSEIREFLVSRRAKITPDQAGLPAYGAHRRVQGLRREEVAMLAGIPRRVPLTSSPAGRPHLGQLSNWRTTAKHQERGTQRGSTISPAIGPAVVAAQSSL